MTPLMALGIRAVVEEAAGVRRPIGSGMPFSRLAIIINAVIIIVSPVQLRTRILQEESNSYSHSEI